MRRGLELLVLASALGACDQRYDCYNFRKEVGDEIINFHEAYIPLLYHVNTLTIDDGEKVIHYVDSEGSDLQIDYVEVRKSGKTTTYSKGNSVGEPVVSQGQKRFQSYLKIIKEKRVAEGLADISGVHIL
ncbi:hypothetical protein HZA98_01815 [Candidatus Woesearchaeota archaeon]|nr:hypothetical protein [Candidatus Woesearchaeota archaeon]